MLRIAFVFQRHVDVNAVGPDVDVLLAREVATAPLLVLLDPFLLCTGCGQAFVVAFSCKGRGVCPSCNGRHMAQTAAHLVDHVIPPVPVRQWVISVPKRLRGMLADRPAAIAALTRIFLDEIERLLCAAAGVTRATNTPAVARLLPRGRPGRRKQPAHESLIRRFMFEEMPLAGLSFVSPDCLRCVAIGFR